MDAPAVTVAIPVFNAERFIEATLASVMAQSFADFEVVVVDDGSGDQSGAIVQSYRDQRIRYVYQTNSGPSVARNAALREARSPLVAFLDADDLWQPDHLQVLMTLSRAYPQAALLGNRYVEFSGDGAAASSRAADDISRTAYRLLDDYFSEWSRNPAPFCTSTVMFRRDAALGAGGYKVGHNRGEDLEFYVRLALAAPVAVSSYVGGLYRRFPNSLTSGLVTSPDICMTSIAEHQATGRVPTPMLESVREFYNKIALGNATDCLLAGEAGAAHRFLELSRNTVWQRRRWLAIRMLLALPAPARRGFVALRHALRSAGSKA